MNLSTNELFHFTDFDSLKSIINSKSFLPNYNLEFVFLTEKYKRSAAISPVAMVCFCDIPLELSEQHRNRYGKAAIALTEEWKLKKGLNPVFYIQSNSYISTLLADFANIITDSFLPIIEKSNRELIITKTLGDIALNQKFLTYCIKQYENKKELKIDYAGKIRVFEKRRFYDEREWRYIPFEAQEYRELSISMKDFDNSEILKQKTEQLKKYQLNFDFEDIEFLIVNDINEKMELDKLIASVYNKEIEIKIIK